MGRTRLIAVVLVLGLALTGAGAGAVRPVDEAIFPAEDYPAPEGRALAEAHGNELVALYADVRRCAPDLDFQLDGIAFQRSKRAPIGPYYLTLWVWLDSRRPPLGGDTARRATEAFRQYGRKLLRQLAARGAVATDARVTGYGLILSWVGPRKIKDTAVNESLVLFSKKDEAVAFAAGRTAVPGFLAVSEVRAFDGQIEVPVSAPTLQDGPDPPGLDGC